MLIKYIKALINKAEYYGIDEDKAYRVIDIGRKLNHSK
jgi:hypothetical protein